MSRQGANEHFVGRTQEIQLFEHWLLDPHAPWILFVHDLATEQEKKGGIGKTWLLRRCAERVAGHHPDVTVVMIDFFSVEERDRFFLVERIVKALQGACPEWLPTSFAAALERYDTTLFATTPSQRAVSDHETTLTTTVALRKEARFPGILPGSAQISCLSHLDVTL